jgi:hypothetical protein
MIERFKVIPLEIDEQKKLVKWLQIKKIFFYSNVSENNTYKQDRKYAMIAEQKAKSQGKLKGVSDITVLLPNKILFIELKKQGKKLKNGNISHSNSKVSDEQIAFLEKVNSFDYAIGKVCYGFDDAKNFIEENV